MQHWDVFHSDRLQAERSLTTEAVRQALARGDLNEDDLIRPAGETRWTRLGESSDFAALKSEPEERPSFDSLAMFKPAPFEPPSLEEEDEEEDDISESDHTRFEADEDTYASLDREALARMEREPSPAFDPPQVSDFELAEDDPEFEPAPEPEMRPTYRQDSSVNALPVLPDEEADGPDLPELIHRDDNAEFDDIIEDDEAGPEPEYDPQAEDDEAAEFTLSRNSAERVEELDLAAMVDVAFQLVLFFLVTAQVVLFKTLEIPRPNDDKPPDAAAQGRSKSVDELEKDYILVEVDAAGAIKVDRQPVAANRSALVERLRKSREDTARKAMLLSADFATRHENAVLVFDVANEIDLKIAIAQPAAKK